MLSRVARAARRRCLKFLRPYSSVVVEDSGPVRVVYINRPEKRNCVNHDTATRLWNAFKQFDEDSSALVAVLAGKGDCFCAGYDLGELASANVDLVNEKIQFDSQAVAPLVTLLLPSG